MALNTNNQQSRKALENIFSDVDSNEAESFPSDKPRISGPCSSSAFRDEWFNEIITEQCLVFLTGMSTRSWGSHMMMIHILTEIRVVVFNGIESRPSNTPFSNRNFHVQLYSSPCLLSSTANNLMNSRNFRDFCDFSCNLMSRLCSAKNRWFRFT